MKYQLRLLDQNLPGLTREIAQACWFAADGVVSGKLTNSLYRDLYRSVREVFRKHVSAFRFCNSASVCERSIPNGVLGGEPRHERFAGEHVHIYLTDAGGTPAVLVGEIVQRALRDVVHHLPGQSFRGGAHVIRHAVEKAFDGRIFPSLRCGDDNLCHANEAYDPWDLRDPINQVRSVS